MPSDTPTTDAALCFVCKQTIGVYRWWCREGQAHPWCIASEAPKWEAFRGK